MRIYSVQTSWHGNGSQGMAVPSPIPIHHLILPLLSRADKETEVRWGIVISRTASGDSPRGCGSRKWRLTWKPSVSLRTMASRFTLLSPHQGCMPREFPQESTSHDGSIDTTVPYLCRLPGGAEITIFFQDAALSSQVAFGDLLEER